MQAIMVAADAVMIQVKAIDASRLILTFVVRSAPQ